MAWYLYDSKGFVSQLATYGGLLDIERLNIAPLNYAIRHGTIENEHDKERVLKSIETFPELNYITDLLNKAQGYPLIISDGGGDPRLEKFHKDVKYIDYPPEDSIQSVADAKRVYEKYVGKWDVTK